MLEPVFSMNELIFSQLPAYARFIRESHLLEYIALQLKEARILNTPLLRIFGDMPDDQIIQASIPGHIEFLTAAEENKLAVLLDTSMRKWINNQLDLVGREEIAAEDITQVSYLRKSALLHFLPYYTSDLKVALKIAHEIDMYQLQADTIATSTYIDILQEKIAKQNKALRKSDELYKQAEALSHLGNWAMDLEDHKIVWSDELYRIYGLEPGTEVNYELIYSFNHPEDAEAVKAAMQQAIEKGERFEFYYRIIIRDGKEKILHARGEILTESGAPCRLIGTLQDVTAQQLAEQQIRRSQEFIRKIADTTPSLIASYNIHTGKYTFINQSIQTILGYDPQEVLDKGAPFVASLLHPDDVAEVTEQNAHALQQANSNPPPADGNEVVAEFKYRLRDKDGHYHWFQTFGTVFDRNAQGGVEHILNVSIDITGRELAEQQLQQKNMELQQSNTSLEEYAYVASHDLKEPLRKIATFSDRLLTTQESLLTEDGKVYLTKIIESSKRMQKMIGDLLAVSVISGNKGFELCNLEEILEEVKQTLEYKIEDKQASVASDKLPRALIVPSQFRQLFQNLISNSLKFAREGVRPEITITHTLLRPDEVHQYRLAKASKYLKIDVSDNGIGFDNQYANKIFTIFQRLHARNEYEGTGIGLSICKKIAENHGGTIVAKGESGKGATFSIFIPA